MLRVQWSFLPWEDAGACLLLMYFFRFPSSLALYLAFHAHRHIFSTICAHLGVFPLKDIEQSAVTHSLCWKNTIVVSIQKSVWKVLFYCTAPYSTLSVPQMHLCRLKVIHSWTEAGSIEGTQITGAMRGRSGNKAVLFFELAAVCIKSAR